MSSVKIDVSKKLGKMKIMHAVNNVPAGDAVRSADSISNYKYFREAGIPFCRNHDAAGFYGYCGEFIVDVHRIFRNFDADENDPASYDFEYTDKYVAAADSVGSEVFYRLGAMIEHFKKVGTYPPKDFSKWARICEHIILHYNEGWADGFHYGLGYWEIWNEPECRNADGSTPCWQGTMEQFYEFFAVVFKHLKGRFPHLKIGGPAFCSCMRDKLNHEFFDMLKKEGIVLDFFSFHGYYANPSTYIRDGEHAYELLSEYGVEGKTELILNEWNFVRGWTGEKYVHSVYAIKGLKGSSYIAGTMASGQASKLDMMMYYDARPCTWSGMFDTTFLTPLKGYYPFKMYGEMYRMGTQIKTASDDECVYAVGAVGDDAAAAMITYFDDNDDAEKVRTVDIEISGLCDGEKKIEYYVLDEENDMALFRTDVTSAERIKTTLEIGLYSTLFIRVSR
ncbi:MAG: hypothetical protein J5832_06125 [Clostridia bacterium]|nr:hypothetical protein [Clostridia bacterium]